MESPTSLACHHDDASDVCRPRLRTRLLVVGVTAGSAHVVEHAAERLRVGTSCSASVDAAIEELRRTRMSCVVLEAALPTAELVEVLGRLEAARADVPVVVIGDDADPTLSLAAVRAGAQDYLVRDELNPAVLERSIRHAIDRKRSEVELARLAHHDALTGLPNRSLFDERLAAALGHGPAQGGALAVLFVDIDGFKRINDSLGHRAGDAALCEAAARIRAVVRPHDTVARLGGDEFTVLCERVTDGAAALAIADRITQALADPLDVGGDEIVLRASIGIALADEPGLSGEQLLRRSDEAMYRAKARGGSSPELYTPGRERRRGADLHLEAELRRAIPSQLVAHYQPVVQLDTGRPVGVEALVRWEHPERGLVPPGEFIPLAEETGLVLALGDWMLAESCRRAARWGDLRVAVNVSGCQVAEGSLVEKVERALGVSGLAPERLQLELTETVLVDDVEGHAALLNDLASLGVTLALDDFGTGYSSLAYLHRFPFSRVKIDRAFVAGLPDDRADRAIVSAVVSFADALDLEVIAEGVETQAHVDALLELGCLYAQGFFFHRPMEAARIDELLSTRVASG